MKADEREIRRKRRILDHALETGNVAKTCRYFGIPRSLFYLWRNTYQKHGQEGLRRKKPIAKSHPNQTENAGRATSAILQAESRMTLNLMSGKPLLLQATRGPKSFDDVQPNTSDKVT